jgi:hypothetical protein
MDNKYKSVAFFLLFKLMLFDKSIRITLIKAIFDIKKFQSVHFEGVHQENHHHEFNTMEQSHIS